MSFTIDATDFRSIRAIEIAGDSGQWLKCVDTTTGETFYGVPSQCKSKAGLYYRVTLTSCDCEDFKRHGLSEVRIGQSGEHGLCKHVRAVRLRAELAEAAQDRAPSGRRRHLHLVPNPTSAQLAQRYSEIFKRFDGD